MHNIVPFARYDVCLCNECGMAYAGNMEESMPLIEYYDKVSKYDDPRIYATYRADESFGATTNFLVGALKKDDEILEFGSARGGLLHALKQKGFVHVCGVEPSVTNCEFVKREYGIEVYPGALGGDTSGVDGRKFDLVILEATMEHIIPLRETIEELHKFVKDGGLLYIGVPDAASFQFAPTLYQEFSTEHVNYFCRESLINLCGIAGFEEEKCTHSSEMGTQHDVMMLFRNTGKVRKCQKEDESRKAVMEYIKVCGKVQDGVRAHKLPNKYYLWGCGTHTAMLYQLGIVDNDHVTGIVDSNKSYQGKEVFGMKVMKPQEIAAGVPIVISSQLRQDSIAQSINETLGKSNEAVKLY